MEKALGFGGLFFRASDPDKLAEWYKTHLGIDKVPMDYETLPWQTEAGTTVFAPFSADTPYFGEDKSRQFMLNFRVRDLNAMIVQLKNADIEVGEVQKEQNGQFARIYDPEGNPIELWQPA